MAECPTCSGTGRVPAHVAKALNAENVTVPGGTCHCDGPPHAYSPPWCPKTGPVKRR